ncbi:helix-turn-helix domain-containing protein [Streptomyces rimosus]|uniref:helix-turn-helix domain-containing protein n=1 Tax=Streptomyces rimosus TaxID=1927 RepID=UPI0004CBB0B5|nr:helix-turn-helix transcriptional regulator [Streptomyces rimosus]
MGWASQAVRDASRAGDYGRVVRVAREALRVSQRQLAEACGTSQSAVSRLETRGTGPYDMTQLGRAADHLRIPRHMVGLADHTAADAAKGDGSVERRNFLAGAMAVVAVPATPTLATPISTADDSGGQAVTLRWATAAFRRMDGSTSSRQLVEPVLAHLRLIQELAQGAVRRDQRARLAAAGSEAAGLAAWLSWDMGDHGSARTWYGAAVKAARRASHPLLAAYQLGSLAQFEAYTGNAAQSLALARQARRVLGEECPAVADAWLSSVEALAHAAAGDAAKVGSSLGDAADKVRSVTAEAPWPWVFCFDGAKVAAFRVACGARLGRADWISAAQGDAGAVLTSGHEKQRALLMLDLASGHLASGKVDGAFDLAVRALEVGLRFKSGRIVERARSIRRAYSPAVPPKVVREFDDRMYDVYV